MRAGNRKGNRWYTAGDPGCGRIIGFWAGGLRRSYFPGARARWRAAAVGDQGVSDEQHGFRGEFRPAGRGLGDGRAAVLGSLVGRHADCGGERGRERRARFCWLGPKALAGRRATRLRGNGTTCAGAGSGAPGQRIHDFLLSGFNTLYLDDTRLAIQRALHYHLFRGELLGQLLIAELVGLLAVK